MKAELMTIFAIASVVLAICSFVYAIHWYRRGKRAKRLFSSVQLCTAGVFPAVVLLFIPIYYTSYDFGDSYHFVRPFLLAVHNSLRIFILDGDFEIIKESVSDQSETIRVCFSMYAALLYVIAPVLTFGSVLSLFKNIKGEFEYRWHRYKKHYIMSELNAKSIALAKSIYERDKNAVIVFTDVYEKEEESGHELLTQARDINAICLKKDISDLDILSKKGDIEIFLIGNDESENVSQAVKITTQLNEAKKKYNVKVFVFSTKESAPYIIDSIRYDNLLAHASEHDFKSDSFKLRRIDEKQQLIWNTIPKMRILDLAEKHDKTISVLLVGMGSYGMEFFKTLIWYCQVEGYRLQINAFDKRKGEKGEPNYMESIINRDCPDLLKMNRCGVEGESCYDVEIFSGVDFMRDTFEKMLHYDGNDAEKLRIAQRLKSTNLAIISLGDDDINIEMAIHMRSLFDRVNCMEATKETSWQDEPVEIYSVVYDDQKSKILYNENATGASGNLLLNYKDVPYHIHFIGGMSSQFDYRNVYDAELETKAYAHHRSWVDVEARLHAEFKSKGRENDYQWYDEKAKEPDEVKKAQKCYEQYEYYRRSSIARELYQREIRRKPELLAMMTCLREGRQDCECDNCNRRKRSEHMRWNAYTRVLGFTYNKTGKVERALQHNNLCAWSELDEKERLKD